MLSKFINSQIYNDVNNLNKLNYLNNTTNKDRKINKYNNVQINKLQFFKVKNNVNVLDYKNIDNISEINLNNNIGNTIEFNINKNIGNIIEINVNKNIDNIIEINVNKNIKKINNVYKINFKNSSSSGFGDFIRGCYFLLQFCEKNNIDIDFHIYDINIKYYLNYFQNKLNINNFIANNVDKFIQINCDFTNTNNIINYNINNKNDNEFVKYLNSCTVYSNNIFINTINFPSYNISKKHIDYMQMLLEPTEQIKIELNNTMGKLGLTQKNFNIYHIRLGDQSFDAVNNLIKHEVLNKILNNLNINKNETYVIISDSVLIKNILTSKYPFIKTIIHEITHTLNNDINKLKNTLLEFYLMSYSKNIISFSIYPHGSGFSKWCSVTYEIPYICHSLF